VNGRPLCSSFSQVVMALMILTACIAGISPSASGAGQNRAPVKKDLVLSARDFNVTVSVGKPGTRFLSDVRGMLGVGYTEEEAKANLSTVKIGKDPAGRDILYVDQKRPVRGLTRLYFDVDDDGIPEAHSAMPSLFRIKELENRLAVGDRSVLPDLNSFLKNESPLVRQAATTVLAKAGHK